MYKSYNRGISLGKIKEFTQSHTTSKERLKQNKTKQKQSSMLPSLFFLIRGEITPFLQEIWNLTKKKTYKIMK